MARPLRLEYPGALYHVTTRGNRRETIFTDDKDRKTWLALLKQTLSRFDATVYAYCLMGNHYHIVLMTRQPNLSRLMRQQNGVYTQRYNRRHGQTGHVFQGRFKAILVDRDAYFLEVCRYVDLNPVRAGLVRRPEEWAWSSYRAHAGQVRSPNWLDSGSLYRQLVSRALRREGPAAYAHFVAQGESRWFWDEALSGQIYLGDTCFARRMQAKASIKDKEVPRTQRRSPAIPLTEYFTQYDRNTAIARACHEGGYTLTAIARVAGLSVSRVSRLLSISKSKDLTPQMS
jgi:REP element-mobilizing transposase RayT